MSLAGGGYRGRRDRLRRRRRRQRWDLTWTSHAEVSSVPRWRPGSVAAASARRPYQVRAMVGRLYQVRAMVGRARRARRFPC